MTLAIAGALNADPGTGQTNPSETDDAWVPREMAILLMLSRLSKLPTRLPGKDISSLSDAKTSGALTRDAN
jgi:hypothetical protein